MATLFGDGLGPALLPALACAWCPEYPITSDLEDEIDPPPYEILPLPELKEDAPPYPDSAALKRSTSCTDLTLLSSSSSSILPAISTTLNAALIQSTLAELLVIASFGTHQVRSIATGLFDLATGSVGRPSWNYGLHIGLHLIRANLAFPGASIPRVRMVSKIAGATRPPTGVQVTEVKFVVDRDQLLEYEKMGNEYRMGIREAHYPAVPAETAKRFKDEPREYELEGEWLEEMQPEGQADGGNSSWFGSWFSSTSSPQQPKQEPKPKSTKVIYFLHGGAYIAGSPKLYRLFTGRITQSTHTKIFAVQYHLAPEHPFPSALHDAFAGYLYLTQPSHPAFKHLSPAHAPVSPSDIILMGDSAGGGLCLSLLNYLNLYLRNPEGECLIQMPSSAVLLSPWVDLTFSSHSWVTNANLDWLPAHARFIHKPVCENVPHPVYMYLYGEDCTQPHSHLASLSPSNSPSNDSPTQQVHDTIERFTRHPLVSPIFASTFENLPPILIQTGDAEVLRDESLALAYKYDSHNVGVNKGSWVRHESYCDMPHVFMAFPWLGLSGVALRRVREFIGEVERGRPGEPGVDEGVLVDSHVPCI